MQTKALKSGKVSLTYSTQLFKLVIAHIITILGKPLFMNRIKMINNDDDVEIILLIPGKT
jgi:hypothetical protein